MMVPRFGFRHWFRRPSLWICLAGIVLSAVPISELGKTAYFQSNAAQSTLVFVVIAPAVSAGMAWEASRFREIAQLGRSSVVRIFRDRMLLWSLVFPVGYVMANLAQSAESLSFASKFFWMMLAYSCVVGICWVLIGSALGFSLKPFISVCAAVALAYTWYAIVPATSPGVLRHLAGDFLACCSLDTTLDVKAIGIAVAGIVGVTLLVVSAAALLRHRRKLYMAALLLGLLAIVGSTFWAQKLTEFGLVQRDSAQIVCVSDVCAWPEVPKENILLNIQAREAFSKIVPAEWGDFSNRPVVWGDFSEDHLSLSSQPTLEGVVGEFVDQVGTAELIRANAQICGIPAKDLGISVSGLPWDPNRQVDVSDVVQRIEQSTCRVSG